MKKITLYFFSPGAICIIFFLIGYLTAPVYDSSNKPQPTHPEHGPLLDTKSQNAMILQQQERAQETLQTRIELLQNPMNCDQARKLVVKTSTLAPVGANSFEKFAREFHLLSLALQVAVSTGRALVLANDWRLLTDSESVFPSNCVRRDQVSTGSKSSTIIPKTPLTGIACLQQSALLNCGTDSKGTSSSELNMRQDQHLDPSLSFGILPESERETENPLFDIRFYGPELSVEMPQWPFPRATQLIDTLPYWERAKGSFWVRSQMVHYIWERWHNGAGVPLKSKTPLLDGHVQPSIVFYWTSSKSLRKNLAVKFGRNASITQDFGRYMEVAGIIRENHLPQAKTIYLITDNSNEAPLPENLESKWPNWDFVLPLAEGQESDEESRLLKSMEIMRRADFLVGSFQSQMFRLACEINAAWFVGKYGLAMRRHWTLDVEWFENP